MLEFRYGIYDNYIYRDGYIFDRVEFIDYYRREIHTESGIVYDMDSVERR